MSIISSPETITTFPTMGAHRREGQKQVPVTWLLRVDHPPPPREKNSMRGALFSPYGQSFSPCDIFCFWGFLSMLGPSFPYGALFRGLATPYENSYVCSRFPPSPSTSPSEVPPLSSRLLQYVHLFTPLLLHLTYNQVVHKENPMKH